MRAALLLRRQNVPLLALIGMTATWAYYYLGVHWLNDYGAMRSEWMLLLDGLVVLPLICAYCLRDAPKQAALKAVAYACLMILLGSWVIPENEKTVWRYLEELRYVAIAAFLVLEISAVATVVLAIRAALSRNVDPDRAIASPIAKWIGDNLVAKALTFEARTWTYALFASRVRADYFDGQYHFTSHNKDATESTLLGFVFLIAFEIPLMHVLLHFMWSPTAANVASVLSALGLVYFIGEYRAMSRRPVSLTDDSLIIRYGLRPALTIPLNQIVIAEQHAAPVRRQTNIKRYNLFGTPNVRIELDGHPMIREIFLGVDQPSAFVQRLTEQR